MANTDFSILLKAVLDKSGINTELKQVQEIVKKYSIDIMPELKTASLRNQMKAVSQEIANDFNKAFGTNVTGNDVFKAFENQAKAVEMATKRAAETQRKADQERLANIEKIRKASQQSLTQKEAEKQTQIKNILDKQINAYREIQSINKQIAGLNPSKDSNQIAALQEKKKIQQEIFLSSQKQLGIYKTQETNEIRLRAFAEERKKTESEIAVIKGRQSDTAIKNDSNASLKESRRVYEELLNTARQLNSLQTKQLKITPDSDPAQWRTLSSQIEDVSVKYDKLWSEFWSKPQNLELFTMGDLNKLKELGYTVEQVGAKIRDNLSTQAGKIQLQFETGGYESKVEGLIAKTNQWVDSNGNARISTSNLSAALQNLNNAYNAVNASGGNTEANQRALIAAEQALDAEIKKTTNDINLRNTQFAKTDQVDRLRQKYQEFYDKNTAAHRKWGAQLKAGMAELASGTEVPIQRANQLEKELIDVQNAARQAGKLGLSFFDKLKQGMASFTMWTSTASIVMNAIRVGKDMVKNVKDIDTAMTSLYKVTDETGSRYDRFLDSASKKAKELGRSVSSLVEQTAEWAKRGYSLNEAEELAKTSSIYANVGEVDDVTAVEDITTAMKAFNIEAEDSISVVDRLNALGRYYAPLYRNVY